MKKMFLIVLPLVLVGQGCVSESEFRSFVAASRGFFYSVAPVFTEATTSDASLSEPSKRNRMREVQAFEQALVAAEARVK